MTVPASGELSVRSESVQRLYSLYLSDKFRVNRRYQRKLVWSVEEKQRLIDSIQRDLPVPLFLVAEIGVVGELSFELIDGLQRLNAIFAFLENEFDLDGEYFDLDTLADTKLLKDAGKLTQNVPVMPRERSAQVANYTLALSVFRATTSASVDEVFRRINSGGRRLSRQELRQAGTVSPLADLVRVVSSQVRGDTSPGDVVPLKVMPQLSITNYKLAYGVPVDQIFWVREGILRREDVRESLDEQLVLDLLIDSILEPTPTSGTRLRDEYYNYTDTGEGEPPTRASLAINQVIRSLTPQVPSDRFMAVYGTIRTILGTQDLKFNTLIGAGSGGRSPRYFHGIFIAIHELMHKDGMRLRDPSAAAGRLKGIGDGAMSVPAGGGDWGRDAKRRSVDAVKGVLRDVFEQSGDVDDLGRYGWAAELETLLSNALVEQQLFDCKQGFLTLEPSSRTFDEGNFTKICRTLSAMANAGPEATGYVAVGIADDSRDADRVLALDGISAIVYRNFHVIGIQREAAFRGDSLNDYWSWILQRIGTRGLSPALAANITGNARLINYQQLPVALLKVSGLTEPVSITAMNCTKGVGLKLDELILPTTCGYSHGLQGIDLWDHNWGLMAQFGRLRPRSKKVYLGDRELRHTRGGLG